MVIKRREGHTLITLLKVLIVFVACLGNWGVDALADKAAVFFSGGVSGLQQFLDDDEQEFAGIDGTTPYLLYYTEYDADTKITRHIHKQYYISGSEGAYGLIDAARRPVLEEKYQDIVILPYAWALKTDGKYQLYSKTDLTPLSDQLWDAVEPEIDEEGCTSTGMIVVQRDGLYGAIDGSGTVLMEPKWDDFDLLTTNAAWPLSRVRLADKYGFINAAGDIIIALDYEQAVMSSMVVEATGEEIPIIYVYQDGRWGGIVRNRDAQGEQPTDAAAPNAPAPVNWDLVPSAEVQADLLSNV
ncbi:MAG: WG repeat-containing protein [Bacillota bacterium]|nr:WG repeat-containing protein [Bacillota bacterium]